MDQSLLVSLIIVLKESTHRIDPEAAVAMVKAVRVETLSILLGEQVDETVTAYGRCSHGGC